MKTVTDAPSMEAIRKAGFRIPKRRVRPTAKEFKELIDEGWRLWLDQDGYVLGYIPPTLWERMAKGWAQ